MLNLRRLFKGDTLIEVTIAIGIFALVAISVVAVVSVSTSGAQSALENTLTREEVDAQAETIRFIQNSIDPDASYESLPDNAKEKLYYALWSRLTNLADRNSAYGINTDVTSFNPDTCSTVYDDNKSQLISQNAFIIDLKKLNTYVEGDDTAQFAKDVILSASDHPELFIPASTYPQLAYSQSANQSGSNESLLGGSLRNTILNDVEGIYVVGMKDINETNYVDAEGVKTKSAYYDFYVRSCWYNSGSENPSSVSTTVRVRDPQAIAYIEPPTETIPAGPERPEITFDNIEWTKYNDTQYTACYQSYCGSSGPSLSQSGSYWSTNCEPAAGQHVTFPNDTSITLVGSTQDAVSLGAYYDKFNVNDVFSLQVDIDATNVGNHPSTGANDGLTIKLSIVNAQGGLLLDGVNANINNGNQSITIPGTNEKIQTSSKAYNLLLEYNRGLFKACVTESGKNQQCISATKQIPSGSYLKVDYNLRHSGHCCDEIAVIKLSNITMRRASTGSITF